MLVNVDGLPVLQNGVTTSQEYWMLVKNIFLEIWVAGAREEEEEEEEEG